MAESKSSSSAPAKDAGASEVQQAFEEAQEKGYFGNQVDPLPNSAHSLESGPDAPTAAEQAAAVAKKDG
jgi:hypothetical protein